MFRKNQKDFVKQFNFSKFFLEEMDFSGKKIGDIFEKLIQTKIIISNLFGVFLLKYSPQVWRDPFVLGMTKLWYRDKDLENKANFRNFEIKLLKWKFPKKILEKHFFENICFVHLNFSRLLMNFQYNFANVHFSIEFGVGTIFWFETNRRLGLLRKTSEILPKTSN